MLTFGGDCLADLALLRAGALRDRAGRVRPDRQPAAAALPDRVRLSAYITGLLALAGWPKGMRVMASKERPQPGAQLRLTDSDGCA